MNATFDQKVLVFDFGAQYGQLIARRVCDLHVYSEIVPCDISADEVRALDPAAIILPGGSASVYAEDAPSIDPQVLELGVPVLGFCYGQQIMAVTLGGEVGHTEKGEYGPAPLTRTDGGTSALYGDTPAEQTVRMSHRDAVTRAPEGFTVTAKTDVCPVASMECPERKLYATQFHPEVRHTPYGNELLKNFLFGVCGLEANWDMDSIIEDSIAAIRAQVGGGPRDSGPFRRRGLLRGCRAVRESHRQAADLRVREPRPAAQERARRGGGSLHETVRRRKHLALVGKGRREVRCNGRRRGGHLPVRRLRHHDEGRHIPSFPAFRIPGEMAEYVAGLWSETYPGCCGCLRDFYLFHRSSVGSTAPRREALSSTVQPMASAMRGAHSSIMSSMVVS